MIFSSVGVGNKFGSGVTLRRRLLTGGHTFEFDCEINITIPINKYKKINITIPITVHGKSNTLYPAQTIQ